MTLKIIKISLCIFASFLFSSAIASEIKIKYDQRLVPILKEVLPLNISEIESLNDNEKKDLECIAWNLYFEARGGVKAEQIAVAWVPINRGQYSHWSKDICETIFQYDYANGRKAFQFVWAGFNLSKSYRIEPEVWQKVQFISYNVYKGNESDPSNGATYFNHYSVGSRRGGVRLGSHVFYR